jgi:hypothetical protein
MLLMARKARQESYFDAPSSPSRRKKIRPIFFMATAFPARPKNNHVGPRTVSSPHSNNRALRGTQSPTHSPFPRRRRGTQRRILPIRAGAAPSPCASCSAPHLVLPTHHLLRHSLTHSSPPPPSCSPPPFVSVPPNLVASTAGGAPPHPNLLAP